MFGKYTKSILSLLAAFGVWWGTAGADGNIDKVELYGLIGVIITALVVAIGTNTVNGKPYIDPSTLPAEKTYNPKHDKE